MQASSTAIRSLDAGPAHDAGPSSDGSSTSTAGVSTKLSQSPLIKFLKDSTAGTIGGIAVTLVGHPFGKCFGGVRGEQRWLCWAGKMLDVLSIELVPGSSAHPLLSLLLPFFLRRYR